jgi:predicted DNA-binding transcriptional regulator AlpA
MPRDLSTAVWLNMREAAEYLGFPSKMAIESALLRSRRNGTAPKRYGSIRSVRFRRTDLDAWMERLNQAPSDQVLTVTAEHRKRA